jgi:prolyl-tRNA editing enzyme YbaK/EbsC (Cys-tRNA(Pro) deacylase)
MAVLLASQAARLIHVLSARRRTGIMSGMIPAHVQAVLERHGLLALEFEPGSTPTVESAARRIGVAEGQIAKSLLFRDKSGAYHLVVCAGDAKVSSGRLKRLVGFNTSMASHEETLAVTGFRPGGVCPFGVTVPVWIDESLRRFTTVYPAAGTDATGVPIAWDQLLASTGGTPCAVCNLPGEAPSAS